MHTHRPGLAATHVNVVHSRSDGEVGALLMYEEGGGAQSAVIKAKEGRAVALTLVAERRSVGASESSTVSESPAQSEARRKCLSSRWGVLRLGLP